MIKDPIIKKAIESWIQGPQDFHKGLKLLQKVSKKHKLMTRLFQWEKLNSDSERYKQAKGKLIHELSAFLRPDSYLKYNNKGTRTEDLYHH